MDKLSECKQLLEQTLQKVTSSVQEWKQFLRFASRIYKYDFTSALLIYAQRPDATALAPIETWNRVGRRVNAGSHGVPTIINDGSRVCLKFLFDVSDTNGEEKTLPQHWQLKKEYQDTLLIDFEERYNISTKGLDFDASLAKIINTYIESNFQDYYDELIEYGKVNLSCFSDLVEFSDDEDVWTFDRAKDVVVKMLTDNVTYMVYNRISGPQRIAESLNFSGYAMVDEPFVFECIGNASVSFSCALLRQIESSVKQIEHDLKRGLNYGISGKGRPVVSGAGDCGAGGRAAVDQIRPTVPEISRGGTSGEIRGADGQSGTDGSLPQSREESERIRGRADQPAPEEESGTKDGQPHGTDSVQQLAVQDGRGNDAGGRSIPEKVTVEEKDISSVGFNLLSTDEQNPNFTTYISEYDFLHEYLFPVLKNGTIFTDRNGIYSFFLEDPSPHEAANYLRNLFPVQKNTILQINDSYSSVWYDSKKLHFDIALPDGDYSRTLNWPTCEKHIRQMIEDGDYLDGMPPKRPQQLTLGSFIPDMANDLSETEQRHSEAEEAENNSITEPVQNAESEPTEKSGTGSAFSVQQTERINYHYSDLQEFAGGQKTHYKANVQAIKLLKTIEKEQRQATSEEQSVLVKYVGWGGIPQAFDKKNENWSDEFKELKELLTEEEYSAARASTLTAFYTPPAVINAVHTALKNAGFTGGNILEPSCGTGRFFGFIRPDIQNACSFYGVELDSITGRIARQLYQKADIRISGYEKTDFPDNFFDVSFGNVPFGEFGVSDARYDKYNLLIHDYFFYKTLDKVRPGGLILFVTSKGTLDKANPGIRKYIAQRAELVGAIRFPNTMMYTEGNTKVTSDLVILQKRDHMVAIEPDWVNLTYLENGVPVNTYFADHPEMMLGDMVFDDSMYGNAKDTALIPHEGSNWRDELATAINSLKCTITKQDPVIEENETLSEIPADPDVKNYTFTVKDDKLYYRENARMVLRQDISGMREKRIHGMIQIRDTLRQLIRLQGENCPEDDIQYCQAELNRLYDEFTYKYGYLTAAGNKLAFSEDTDYPLLASLECVDDDDRVTKAAIFTKRTIRPPVVITSCETAVEALPHSLDRKGCVDIPYIAKLTGKSEDQVISDLKTLIYLNPETGRYEAADEYLSGNVREKLTIAETFAMEDSKYSANVEALRMVQPVDLDASQIDVRLGSPLLDRDDIKEFIIDLLKPSAYDENNLKVNCIPSQALWKINGIYHAGQLHNILAGKTYGTHRIDAYEIIEITLNQKIPTIRDKQPDDSYKINSQETAAAREKQRVIERKFEEWVFSDPKRRERLVWKYNQTYNNTRIRKFDGSYLTCPGMTPEITLKPHQKNAVARILQSGNTLLAHCVGAGKTYTMIAAAMESKRLGLCNKSMMVVPGHLIDQWGADILRLYPGANVLLATKNDFEKSKRQHLISRIATGDYDIIVIAQSSFEKIPISQERIERLLNKQIGDIVTAMDIAMKEGGKDWTVKAMERTKKGLEEQLKKLTDQTRKDDLLTFEQLGVDQIFVDEAHYYKNLFVATKMVNVAGISQQKAQKASDMLLKCRYINELHNGQRGVVFATGTPVSNSMAELFTMQTYLQPLELEKRGLAHFDSWAANFGRVVSSLELTPDGTQYRYKSRFQEFVNLPELMSLYSMVADIQSADMLKLPVPELKTGKAITIVAQPSERQIKYVQEIVERFEMIHNGSVEPYEDNALKATNDGRFAALDMRMVDPAAEDYEFSKLNLAVRNIFDIWQRSADVAGAQMVFCDISTPQKAIQMEMVDGVATMIAPEVLVKFNAYYDIRKKLINLGIPKEQIEFIHNAKTEKQKEALFSAVRNGKVRILLGSTALMGAGTNAQKHLIAEHHLDAPWRPADVEQREGRILRRGNDNPVVEIYRYVTEGTFDAYSWQILEQKQRFISQVSKGDVVARHAADIDNAALDYATVKMLSSKDPRIKEREELRVRVTELNQLKAQYKSEKYSLEDDVLKNLPAQIAREQQAIDNLRKDIALRDKNESEEFSIKLFGHTYSKREDAGAIILKKAAGFRKIGEYLPIGEYRGFRLELTYSEFYQIHSIVLCGAARRITELGNSSIGCTARMDNLLKEMEGTITKCQQNIKAAEQQKEEAQKQLAKPWEYEKEYKEKTERLNQLDIEMAAEIGTDKEQMIDDNQENVDDDKPASPLAAKLLAASQSVKLNRLHPLTKNQFQRGE